MRYYTNRRKSKLNSYVLIIISIILIFNLFFYYFNKRIFPSALDISKNVIKAKVVETIGETSVDLFNSEFNYNEMIIIDKDNEGNINLIRADTVKLNNLTSALSIKCNEKLQNLDSVEVKVPLSWLTDQSALYNIGPTITVKIEHVGNMNISYESKFESAGINMTRHKIYINVETKIKAIVPLHSEEIEILCQIPISETIIVGKTPQTAIDFGNSNS